MAKGETRIGNSDYISMGAPTEDPATGAFDGEYFPVTGNGTGAGIFFLNNAVTIMYGNNDEVSLAFDNNGLNFVLGQNDDVYLAYDGNQSVIDIGKGTAVDILANTGPLCLYDFQNDPTARLILPPNEDTNPILFVGLQVTGAILALSDTTGAYTLQMYNGTTLVDSTQIREVGASAPSFGLTPESYGAYITQGPIPGSIGVPVVYNVTGQGPARIDTLSTTNGESLDLTDDFSTTTVNVNVSGTLNLNAQVLGLFSSMSFTGGSINFVGTTTLAGANIVFSDHLTGNALINDNHGGNGYSSGHIEINGTVDSGLTFDIEGGGPPASMQIDNPASFHGLVELAVNGSYSQPLYATVTLLGLQVTSADLIHAISGPAEFINMYNGNQLVDQLRISGNTTNLYVAQTATGVVVGDNQFGTPIVGNVFHS